MAGGGGRRLLDGGGGGAVGRFGLAPGRLGEWYGLNKDMDWGAYCIMGGWVMGYVPLSLMSL